MKIRSILVVVAIITLIMQIGLISDSQYVQAQTTVKPEARGAHSMAFDPYNNVAIIFGGFSLTGGWRSLSDTWTYSYSENSWTELVLTPSPSARSNHAMVYCSETNEVILYGGQGAANPTDTWSFACDTQTWSQVATSVNPGVHHSLALAYDPQENAVILFGGFGDDGLERDDTWKFDCDTREWSELSPAEVPLARYGHVMVYDDSINKIVMTSGNTASQGHQDDTWIFDTSTSNWTQLTPTGNPDHLKWPSMTYDSTNKKCILFGGQIGDNSVDRTWIYDGLQNTWQRRYPSESPEDRINTGLAFDSTNNVTILFGGIVIDGAQFDDTWVYSYEDNVWTEMEVGSGATTSNGAGFDSFLILVAVPVIISAVIIVIILRRRR
ncbi:MAG: Kelch repeat-containing protein [Candidatus Thorarchaeota archaeon]